MSPANSPQRPRWWPLYAIAAADVLALALIWLPERQDRQMQVMMTIGLLILSQLLGVLWLLAFSRLRWRLRLQCLGGLAVGWGLAVGNFRIEGVSGDWVPVVQWRWGEEGGRGEPTREGVATLAGAHDSPQFLGPERNGQLSGFHLEGDWEKHPPRLLWRREVGDGWSSFAVVGGRAITQEQHGDEERVVCYELASGRILWSHADSVRYASSVAGIGPRATPTIDGDQVFAMGATGILNCLDLESGARRWACNIVEENGAADIHWGTMWGVSRSPLLLDDLVVVNAGGPEGRSLVAYDRDTGERIWSGGNDPASYSSPTLATLAGRSQIVVFNSGSVAAHDPTNGRVLWRQPWNQGGFGQVVAQPVLLPGDRVLFSSGYGVGAKLYRVAATPEGGLGASIIWESPRLKAKFASMVYRDGFVYGLDDGVLVCLDPTDGERRWKRGRYGHGQVILVEDLLLIATEFGEVVLVEARPDRHNEVARLTALEGKSWNPPALAGPYLLLRNDQEAVCYELTLAESM